MSANRPGNWDSDQTRQEALLTGKPTIEGSKAAYREEIRRPYVRRLVGFIEMAPDRRQKRGHYGP